MKHLHHPSSVSHPALTARQVSFTWPCLMNSGDDAVSVEPTLNPPGTWPPLSLVRINMLINGFMADGGRAIWYLSNWLRFLQFIGQLRLEGQKALNAKHSQPPSPQLIKVALRAWIRQWKFIFLNQLAYFCMYYSIHLFLCFHLVWTHKLHTK